MKIRYLAAIALFALAGCTTTQVADVAVSTTQAPSGQAATVEDAVRLTKLAEDGLDIAVNTGKLPKPVLDQLNVLVPAVHNVLKKIEAANAAGNNALVAAGLASFNEALTALNAYKAQKGVK